MRHVIGLLIICVTAFSAPARAQTLEKVKLKGIVSCGANPGLAGFSMPDKDGQWQGLDVDYCRAIAAAVLDDGSKVQFLPLSSKDRFTALQSGEIDALIRNTTWTLSRDASLGLDFPAINFFDGQAFLVKKAHSIKQITDLAGASICVIQGSTAELNLADYFRSRNLKYEVVAFSASEDAIQAFEAGRCDSFTNDSTALAGYAMKLRSDDDHAILPELISKEPLSSAVRQGDTQWSDIVRWVHFARLNAEELGVTSQNVDEMVKSPNPEIRRLLGVEGNFGETLGLGNRWAYNIIKMVGNYGESFERNLGEGSPLKTKRGLNDLWTRGGLQYAPPIR